MSKTHSHAPWKIQRKENGLTYVVSVDGKMVARCVDGDSQAVQYNQLLIAAAPELLAAVIAAYDIAICGEATFLPYEVLEKLRAAYRSATGVSL